VQDQKGNGVCRIQEGFKRAKNMGGAMNQTPQPVKPFTATKLLLTGWGRVGPGRGAETGCEGAWQEIGDGFALSNICRVVVFKRL
jgi:hypothetical protein